jgi:hypothetical protein
MLALGDAGQFAAMRMVLSEAGPDDLVLDGWSGLGALRRHASYYWMLHPGVRAMLTEDEVTAFVETFVSGRVQPTVVVFDASLRAFAPALQSVIDREYRLLEGDIFVRRRR